MKMLAISIVLISYWHIVLFLRTCHLACAVLFGLSILLLELVLRDFIVWHKSRQASRYRVEGFDCTCSHYLYPFKLQPSASEVVKGSTVGRLAVLPQTNRIDSQVFLGSHFRFFSIFTEFGMFYLLFLQICSKSFKSENLKQNIISKKEVVEDKWHFDILCISVLFNKLFLLSLFLYLFLMMSCLIRLYDESFLLIFFWQALLTAPDENDSKKGILSLIDRGFIPPGAQLELDPPPIKSSLVPIHSAQHRQTDRDTALKGA